MLGVIKAIQDDKKAVFVELNKPADFHMGEEVNVSKPKRIRSLKQNAIYWTFLSWLINPKGGDLKSQGHYSTDSLHENIKAWLKETHPQQFEIDYKFSTTELTRKEFGEFLDIVNQELFVEFLGVDTSGFWAAYDQYIGSNGTDGFKRFMSEYVPKVPF
jgi:hypothetical protein